MKVEILTHTTNPEKVIASAAKLCYSQAGASGLMEGLTDEKAIKFIDKLMSIGHESPVEHVSFTFAIEGISRVASHQLVRHRIASFSQQSQRYVKLNSFEYIVPKAIENNKSALRLFKSQMLESNIAYSKITSELLDELIVGFMNDNLYTIDYPFITTEIGKKLYRIRFMEKDYKKQLSAFEKKAIEDARYVFPNACETKMVVTMNARSLINFFKHRCCDRAQEEIRDMANEMLIQVKEIAPTLFKYAGAPCVSGKCTEGSMTCGKSKG